MPVLCSLDTAGVTRFALSLKLVSMHVFRFFVCLVAQ